MKKIVYVVEQFLSQEKLEKDYAEVSAALHAGPATAEEKAEAEEALKSHLEKGPRWFFWGAFDRYIMAKRHKEYLADLGPGKLRIMKAEVEKGTKNVDGNYEVIPW